MRSLALGGSPEKLSASFPCLGLSLHSTSPPFVAMRFLASPGNNLLPSFWVLFLPSLAPDPFSGSRLASSSPDFVNGTLCAVDQKRLIGTCPFLCSPAKAGCFLTPLTCRAEPPSLQPLASRFFHTHLTQMPFSVKPSPTTLASAPRTLEVLNSMFLGFHLVIRLP